MHRGDDTQLLRVKGAAGAACWSPPLALCMRAVTLVSECVIKGVTGLPWHTPLKKRKKNGIPLDSPPSDWLVSLILTAAIVAPAS